jgi:hypothetical protein
MCSSHASAAAVGPPSVHPESPNAPGRSAPRCSLRTARTPPRFSGSGMPAHGEVDRPTPGTVTLSRTQPPGSPPEIRPCVCAPVVQPRALAASTAAGHWARYVGAAIVQPRALGRKQLLISRIRHFRSAAVVGVPELTLEHQRHSLDAALREVRKAAWFAHPVLHEHKERDRSGAQCARAKTLG